MNKKLFFSFGILAIFLNLAFAQELPLPLYVKEFDTRVYRPSAQGLKEMVFQVKRDGLAEELNKRKNFGQIKEVFYEVYFLAPEQAEFVVEGRRPNGEKINISLFETLASELDRSFRPLLGIIFAKGVEAQLEGYALSEQTEKGIKKVVGEDKTGKKEINRVEYHFNDKNVLTFMSFMGKGVNQRVNFNYVPNSKAGNKYLLMSLNSVRESAGNKFETDTNFSYKEVNGFVLLEDILVMSKRNGKGGQKIKYVFSDYVVNTNKASEFFKKLNKI